MKKILTILPALVLAFTMTACTRTDTQVPDVTQAQTEPPFELILDGVGYSREADAIRTSSVSPETLEKLTQMTGLKQVTVLEGGDGENLEQLRQYCDANGILFQVELAGEMVTDETTERIIPNVTENQLQLLMQMPKLQTLHFPEPEAPAQTLLELAEKLPEARITWEKTVLGMTFPQNAAEIDLTKVIALADGQSFGEKTAYEYGLEFQTMGTQEKPPKTAKILPGREFPDKTEDTEAIIAEVEAAMPYFPEAETLLMCGAWLENEQMSGFRERHRQEYKVVWSVLCGDIAPRTDVTFFMPMKYHSTGFNDLYSHNLKYCEEIVSMDIGHMRISDIDFVRYMPNLKYLVLYNQLMTDLSPLAECKNLVYLEIYSCEYLEDLSALQQCTALEDVNLSRTTVDLAPILEMTWLKNVWMVGRTEEDYQKVAAALPDTQVGYRYGNADDGWRNLPNYYKMRDALLMFYMK